tara:strand:- start:252 stop:497 length:246 start_codon:yes stop_codon:yes gene_type:complete
VITVDQVVQVEDQLMLILLLLVQELVILLQQIQHKEQMEYVDNLMQMIWVVLEVVQLKLVNLDLAQERVVQVQQQILQGVR